MQPPKYVNRLQLRRWLAENYGESPSYYTISRAIRNGLPAHRHPFLPDRIVFDLDEVKAWIDELAKRPVLPPPALKINPNRIQRVR